MAKTKKPATKRRPSKATEISKTKVTRKALEDIGLHVPNLGLILTDKEYAMQLLYTLDLKKMRCVFW